LMLVKFKPIKKNFHGSEGIVLKKILNLTMRL
jgi:hypothetical protein